MRAYHFSTLNGKTKYTNEPIVIGERLEVEGPLSLCVNGLHGSKRIVDALEYAPGCLLHVVELEGEILEDEDKCCAQYRTPLATVDFTRELKRFTQWCAERTERYATLAETNAKQAADTVGRLGDRSKRVRQRALIAAKNSRDASDAVSFTIYAMDTAHYVRDVADSARIAAGCARDAAKYTVMTSLFARNTESIMDDGDITEHGDFASHDEGRLQEDKLQELFMSTLNLAWKEPIR